MSKTKPWVGRNSACLTGKGLIIVLCALISINMYFGNFEKIRNVHFTTYNFNSITFRKAFVDAYKSALYADQTNSTSELISERISINSTFNDVNTTNTSKNDAILSASSNNIPNINTTVDKSTQTKVSEKENIQVAIQEMAKRLNPHQTVDIRNVPVLHRGRLEALVHSVSNSQGTRPKAVQPGPQQPGAAVARGPGNDQSGQFSCTECFKHNYNYLLDNPDICKETSSGQTIDILFLVLTIHGDFEAREAIRTTWLSVSKQNTANIRYAFLLGQMKVLDNALIAKVNNENEKYKDIIKEDFIDTYNNLTLKTIMGYKWAATKCPRAKVVVKIDDDMFINVDRLRVILRENEPFLRNTVLGSCSNSAKPIRSPKSKWYASAESYRDNSYPGFCSGTCYVTGMDVVQKVYKASENIPFFHLEDVYLGLCLRRVNAKVKNIRGFNRQRVPLDPCVYKKGAMVTSHQVPPKMLVEVWNRECRR